MVARMTTQDIPNRLALSRVEAAELLGLSPATIDRLTKRNLLRPCRATRRPIYALAELHRFLNETTSDLTPLSAGASGIGGTCHGKEVKNHGEAH